MAKITLVATNGERRDIEVPHGTSIMQAAVDEGVAGIVAECGGNCMCATCHVYVDPAWMERLPPMRQDEDDMLDSTASPRRPDSRLSCQILATPELDGLVLHLPPAQI